jgi:2-dehydro-3-deoxyglucarate aldolase/4-hydroxy-2-oxoheptanedioate aldolase
MNFRAQLRQSTPFIGTILSLAAPEIVEIAVKAGFDWLFLDMEHSTLDIPSAQRMLQAAGDIPCLVRVPAHDVAWIKKALDIGAAGVIFPQVNTPEQAAWAVSQSKYPPQGVRSVGLARCHGYGPGFDAYVETANEQVAVIVQAEHVEAVHNIHAILDVPGIDGIFIGPFDLSASMGKTGQINHPEVQAAIARVKAACDARHMPISIFCPNLPAAHKALAAGYTFPAVGIDVMLISEMYTNLRQQIKETI